MRCFARKPNAASVWAWWWPSWCGPTTCKPSPINSRRTSSGQPAEVVRWYHSDNRRLAEVEAVVIENNVTNFVLGKAQVNDKSVSFDELMAQQA